MTTLTVNIDNKKTEKAVKAVLEALGLNYNVEADVKPTKRPLNKAEQRVYNDLKKTANQIKLYKEGKIEFQDARAAVSEIDAELGE
jgi:signal recognition particle subunit SEC65